MYEDVHRIDLGFKLIPYFQQFCFNFLFWTSLWGALAMCILHLRNSSLELPSFLSNGYRG